MKIHDLVKPLDQMTDEELLIRVREIRHRRETLRPAAKARAARVEKKTTRKVVDKTAKLLDNLTEAERLALIARLTGESV